MASLVSRLRRLQPITRKPKREYRLILELLEDRTVPSSLQLSLSQHALVEGPGPGSTSIGTVTRVNTDTSQALTVNLVSSDTTEATVPAYVVIPAGQMSASFGITTVNDGYLDGTQNVTISATAQLPTHVQPDLSFAGSGSILQSNITQDVALQPDGKIVTVGLRYNGGTTNPYDFAVSRYNASGSVDTSFGGTGTVYTDVSGQSDRATAVVIQPDGRILVAGTGGNGPHFFFVLARYLPNGALDTSFGSGGKIVTDPSPSGAYNEIWDMTLQPDGRILAAGDVTIGSEMYFAVARYNPNGALDTTFGSNGIATTNPSVNGSDRAYSVLVQPDGKIVLVGGSAGGNSVSHFALSRFMSWGAVDYSFGANGTVTTDLPGTYEQAFDAALQPDGKIVAVGQTSPTGSPVYNFALARYNSDGSLDPSFGANGFVSMDMSGNDQAEGVALAPDGRIVVVGGGVTASNSTMYTVIADYNADGTLGNSYISRSNGIQGQALVIQPDGKVVTVSAQNTAVGGYLDRYGPVILISASDMITVQDNTNPVIQPDAYTLAEDQTFNSYNNYPNTSVLSNDYSPNGGLTASLVSGPAHGTLSFNPDGTFVYTPAPNYNGTDSFVYQAIDPLGMGGLATVSLTIAPMDDPILVTVPGTQTTAEDTPITFSAANGNSITIADADQPRVLVALLVQNAIITLPNTTGLQFYPGYTNNAAQVAFYADTPAAANAALNGLIVTPAPNYNGTINFNVFAQDTTAGSSYYATMSANVNITVTPVNDPPVAINDSYTGNEDSTLTGYGMGVLGNDTDPEMNSLTASLVSGPAHGTVTLNVNGSFTYVPNANYNGTDSFSYVAIDSGGLSSAPASVVLTIWPIDDPTQMSGPGSQTIAEDSSLTFSAANGNAITITDIESPTLLVELFVQNGILTLPNTAGLDFLPGYTNNSAQIAFYADNPAEANAALDGLVFTPNPNYNGPAYLNAWVEDTTIVSYAVTASASVPITVTSVNDAPVAADDSYTVESGVAFNTTYIVGVLANDSDVDSPIIAELVDAPQHGTLSLNADGSFTYTADSAYTGSDTFTYVAFDGQAQSNLATVTFNAIQNHAPVAVGDAYTVNEDNTLSVAAPGVLGNDSDADGQPLTAQLVSGPAHGALTLNATGSFTYTPGANYNGPDEFSYHVSDGTFLSDPVAVTLTVNAVNDAPVAGNDSYSVNEDNVLTVAASGVLANDSDVDSPTLSAVLVSGPSHGSVNLNADGSFTYTPSANYNGADGFSYKANDGQADSNVATVSITVNAVNDAPVAGNDSFSTNEDVALTGSVLGNDSDIEGSPLSAALVAGPAHGSLTLNASGSFTYTPSANFNGPDSFTYKVSDGSLDSNVATVSITVNPVNDPPVAVNDSFSTNEDTVLTGNVLGNDIDVDGNALTATLQAVPTHGSVTLNTDGSFTYTPNANYNGPDSFTYKANDGTVDSGNVAIVAITVNPVNDPPVAGNDAYSVYEDQVLTVTPIPGVTSLSMVSQAGDYIGQGHTYSFTPQNGTFMVNRNFDNGVSIYYSGGSEWWNLDFAAPNDAPLTVGTYANATRWPFQAAGVAGLSVTGDGRGSNTLTGSFTVTQVLYAADGSVLRFAASFVQHNEGGTPALTGSINYNAGGGPSGVLINDSDVDGNPLSIIVTSGPAHGTLAMNVDGSFKYTPSANYNGPDSFNYKVSDGAADSNVATVSINVISVNDPPTAVNDSYTVAEDNVLTVAAPGVLANDSDVDGDPLTASLVTSTTHGSLTFNANGSFTYTPSANYNGSDSFQYAAFDGMAFSFIGTVTLTVTSVNDAPVAGNDSYTTAEDTPLTVAAAGVLANDSDVEASSLTAILVNGPGHGTVTLNSNGSFTYTPSANYNGSDSFTYKANDGGLNSNFATVSLTVTAVNDAPTAAADLYTGTEDQPLVVAAPGVLSNDGDVDGDALSATLVSGPTHGTLSFNADGSFTYTPSANYNGSDSFTYKVSDGNLNSNVAMVSLTVTPVNDAPTATSDAYTLAEDNTLTIAAQGVLVNDSDVDGDSLSALLVSGPAHGTLTLNADGSFVYTPSANYNGPDSFTYKANDGAADSNVVTVALTVTPVNDAPQANGEAYTLAEDTPLVVAAPGLLANDTDVDGDALTAVFVNSPAHGILNLHADGSFTYTPFANYYGADNFFYKVYDGNLYSPVMNVNLDITPVNDNPVPTAGPNQTVNEGATVTFAGSATDADGDLLTYSWNFGDGATGTGAAPTHTYADSGVYTSTLTVSDNYGGSASSSLVVTVLNVAPTAGLSGPATGARGQTRTFSFNAADPSVIDQAGSFTFNVNWGDGTSQPSSGPASQQLGHVYAAAGNYTVRVTATDKDGGVSTTVQQTITINAVDVQAGVLVIGGTAADDNITVAPADAAGNLTVTINGSTVGTYAPPAQIVVYGQAGNDQIKLNTKKIGSTTYYVAVPAALFGDAGNDTLDARGSTANNILIGGAGTDTLQGGSGRDLLIGGAGADTLHGNGGDDLVIGNSTDFDANLAALNALMAEWARTDADYTTRINHLSGASGGLNGGNFLTYNTVHDDAAIDQLYGETGSDWFYYTANGTNKDRLNDLGTGEVATGQ